MKSSIGWSELYGPRRRQIVREYKRARLKRIVVMGVLGLAGSFLMLGGVRLIGCLIAGIVPEGGYYGF